MEEMVKTKISMPFKITFIDPSSAKGNNGLLGLRVIYNFLESIEIKFGKFKEDLSLIL